MSDENKEEKKPEEQAPPRPWLIRQLKEIEKAIEEKRPFKEVSPLFEKLFDEITSERYSFTDKESQVYLQSATKWFQKRFKDKTIELTSDYLNRQEKFLPLLKIAHSPFASKIWKLWWDKAKEKGEDNRQLLDSMALDIFILAEKNTLESICKKRWYEGDFHNLVRLAGTIYSDDPSTLDKIGIVLGKSGNSYMSDIAMTFRARAQALWIKEELKEETKEEVQKIVSDETQKFSKEITEKTDLGLGKLSKELQDGLKEAKENENRMTRNFVQIIGIFAAIIAFIVTIVPTAVRLGGASIPVALAGLAIVVAGIIILLAMIFGRGDKPSGGLIAGISIIGGLFAAWLVVTIWLAIYYPDILTSAR